MEAVAVWDTVGALGIPLYVEKDVRADPFRFADTKLSAKVKHGFHAIACDERRDDFEPTFWDRDPRIAQVLFPGAHADVGGGYPSEGNQCGLSDGALIWMASELATLGVAFAPAPSFVPTSDSAGVAHQPWVHLPFDRLPNSARKFPAAVGLAVSKTLLNRLRAGAVVFEPGQVAAIYAPGNLADYLDGPNVRSGIDIY